MFVDGAEDDSGGDIGCKEGLGAASSRKFEQRRLSTAFRRTRHREQRRNVPALHQVRMNNPEGDGPRTSFGHNDTLTEKQIQVVEKSGTVN